MRSRKVNLSSALKKIGILPIKIIVLCIIAVFTFYFTLAYIRRIAQTSDYFKIKELISNDVVGFDGSYLKGKNIFSIDLRKESGYILQSRPDYSHIRIVRVLPDRLYIDFVKRKAVALVKLYKYFTLDKNGVLFSYSGQNEDLPVILGLETKIFGPRLGKRYNLKEVDLALTIISEAKKNAILKDYIIKRVDVRSLSSVSVFISVPLGRYPRTEIIVFEVKLGRDNIREKIEILGGILRQSKNELANIKYIDLRFAEPAVKLKNAL